MNLFLDRGNCGLLANIALNSLNFHMKLSFLYWLFLLHDVNDIHIYFRHTNF